MVKLLVAASLVLALAFLCASRASARIVEAGPDRLSDTKSLADLVGPGKTVHIIYVHGMRAVDAGASRPLAALLRDRLGFANDDAPPRDYLAPSDLEPVRYMDRPIWNGEADVRASRPFVDHYRLKRSDGAKVLIDEVNWWPLVFPLKCKFLLVPEHDLSGDDLEGLAYCGLDPAKAHYDWLSADDRAELARRPRGGHAALANRSLKQKIMNWGLADAVIAGGPMRHYLNEAMDQAFEVARKGSQAGDGSFVVMSESLGSFVVLDAMRGHGAVAKVMERTHYLYFFANQFALLEMARLTGISSPAADSAARSADDGESPLQALQRWAAKGAGLADRPRQIVAFSDPSDILTYRVPAMSGVTVVNLYDRNTPRWLGLYADPGKAHTGHLANKRVWKILIRP
jgi:hypothetical protein